MSNRFGTSDEPRVGSAFGDDVVFPRHDGHGDTSLSQIRRYVGVDDVDSLSQFVLDGFVVVFDGRTVVEDGGYFGPNDVAYSFLSFRSVAGGVARGGASVAVFVVSHVKRCRRE